MNLLQSSFELIRHHFPLKQHLLPAHEYRQLLVRALYSQLRQGIEYFRQHLDIMFNYVMLLFLFSTVRTMNILLAPFAKNELKVGAEGFGYIQAAFAVGAIAGGFLLPQVSRLYGANRTMSVTVWTLSASIILFATSSSLWMAILGYFLIGLTIQVRVLYLTEAQNSTDINYQGRVYSLFSTLMSLVSLAIYTVMGLLGEVVSQRWLYILQGLLIATSIVLAKKSVSLVKRSLSS